VAKQDDQQDEVLQFIALEIDSVPELEALLLLWQQRPRAWSAEEVAKRLYIAADDARTVLLDLKRKDLISASAGLPDSYQYDSDSKDRDRIIGRTEEVYRRQLVRISTMIHSKPSSAIRDFARAFRFTREK
jgi:predicted ArsR family transcriptional regulator